MAPRKTNQTTDAITDADPATVDLADADDVTTDDVTPDEEVQTSPEVTPEVLVLPDGPRVDGANLAEQYNLGSVNDSDVIDSGVFAERANAYVESMIEVRNAAVATDQSNLRAAHNRMMIRLGIRVKETGLPDIAGTTATYRQIVTEGLEAAIWSLPADATDEQKKEHNLRKSRSQNAVRKTMERNVTEWAVLSYWAGTGPFAKIDPDTGVEVPNPVSEVLKANPAAFGGLTWTAARVAADGFVTHPSVLAQPPEWAKREIAGLYSLIKTLTVPVKYGGAADDGTGAGPDKKDEGKGKAPDAVAAEVATYMSDKTKVSDVEVALMSLRVDTAASRRQTGEVNDRDDVVAIWKRKRDLCNLQIKCMDTATRGSFTEEDAVALEALRFDPRTDGAVKTQSTDK